MTATKHALILLVHLNAFVVLVFVNICEILARILMNATTIVMC